MATTDVSTPPRSRSSSDSSSTSLPTRRRSPNLSLDLKDLPGLSQPSPPTNTLIIINLDDPIIFTASNLASIRQALDSEGTLYSFSPLKSFRRIICAFHTIDSAASVRSKLDGESVLGNRIRVYFGTETKLTDFEDQHLKAPSTGKLFFISPPPSPPHGWESREEEPPNKEVHADDLTNALHKLTARAQNEGFEQEGGTDVDRYGAQKFGTANSRQRADSRTMIYQPVEQGHSPLLPAIAVEDMSEESSPMEATFDHDMVNKPITHTARPPVELMEE